MGQSQLRNGESGTWTPKGHRWGWQILGIRAGGQVEGLVDLHGTESDSTDLTLVSGRVREGGDRGRARDRAEAPLRRSAIRRVVDGVPPVYRRSRGTASCRLVDFVAEIGPLGIVCHIRASSPIPGLVPSLLDSLSFGN